MCLGRPAWAVPTEVFLEHGHSSCRKLLCSGPSRKPSTWAGPAMDALMTFLALWDSVFRSSCSEGKIPICKVSDIISFQQFHCFMFSVPKFWLSTVQFAVVELKSHFSAYTSRKKCRDTCEGNVDFEGCVNVCLLQLTMLYL